MATDVNFTNLIQYKLSKAKKRAINALSACLPHEFVAIRRSENSSIPIRIDLHHSPVETDLDVYQLVTKTSFFTLHIDPQFCHHYLMQTLPQWQHEQDNILTDPDFINSFSLTHLLYFIAPDLKIEITYKGRSAIEEAPPARSDLCFCIQMANASYAGHLWIEKFTISEQKYVRTFQKYNDAPTILPCFAQLLLKKQLSIETVSNIAAGDVILWDNIVKEGFGAYIHIQGMGYIQGYISLNASNKITLTGYIRDFMEDENTIEPATVAPQAAQETAKERRARRRRERLNEKANEEAPAAEGNTEAHPNDPNTGPLFSASLKQIPVNIQICLASMNLPLDQVRSWHAGQIVDVDVDLNRAFAIHANGKYMGDGELVLIENKIGVQIKSWPTKQG